ncbi:extracellular solute-binding protein (plasmid) [Phaeobacter sp. BS23]|uniref:extracellular solute-binding protein n=1 Tax=Phaeobacter sp. BS23 TaxID=2907239 RepID=UPI00386F3C9D
MTKTLATSLLALSLAGAAWAQTEITIISGQEKQNGEVLKQVFGDFDAANSDVAVDFQIDNKSDLETIQQVLADIVAGRTPDAVRVTGAVLSTIVNSGRAQPLDACLEGKPDLMAQLDTGLLDNFRGADGNLYAMPFYTTLPSLYINATAFEAAGLDPANPPTTWTEMEAAAAALTDAANNKFGVLMYMPNTYLFEAQMESAGGAWVDGDGAATAANDGAVTTMGYMRGLVEKGYMPAIAPSAFWGEFAALFRSGDLGMMVFSSSTFPGLTGGLDFDVTIAPMPIADDGTMVANASANGFVMLATDPEKQAATCEALSALVTPENVTAIVEATATVPHNSVAATGADYLAPYFEANPAFVAVNAQPSGAWYAMPGRQNNEFQSQFADIQFQIINGDLTPEEGMVKLQDVMADLLADG